MAESLRTPFLQNTSGRLLLLIFLKLFFSNLFQYFTCNVISCRKIYAFYFNLFYSYIHWQLACLVFSANMSSGLPWFVFSFSGLFWIGNAHFLLVWKIILFSHEKEVATESHAGHWFYAPMYAKWLLKSSEYFYRTGNNLHKLKVHRCKLKKHW